MWARKHIVVLLLSALVFNLCAFSHGGESTVRFWRAEYGGAEPRVTLQEMEQRLDQLRPFITEMSFGRETLETEVMETVLKLAEDPDEFRNGIGLDAPASKEAV